MEEIDEGSGTWPHFSNIGFLSRCIHNKNTSLESLFVGTATSFDPSIDDRDVSVSACDISHDVEREPSFVDGEVFVIDHIVDIAPNGVQGQSVLFVVGNDIQKGISIFISPPALVEAQGPERRDVGPA